MDNNKGIFRSFQEESRGTTKNGKPYTRYSITVEFPGTGNTFRPGFFSWNRDVLAQVKALKPGSMITFTISDDGRKNLESVTVLDEAPAAPSKVVPMPGAKQPAATRQGGGGQFRDPDEIIRGEALGIAVKHYRNVLESSDNLKLVKKTETLENLEIGLFEFAAKAERFIKGKFKVETATSSAENVGPPADVDTPPVPGGPEDDIPF